MIVAPTLCVHSQVPSHWWPFDLQPVREGRAVCAFLFTLLPGLGVCVCMLQTSSLQAGTHAVSPCMCPSFAALDCAVALLCVHTSQAVPHAPADTCNASLTARTQSGSVCSVDTTGCNSTPWWASWHHAARGQGFDINPCSHGDSTTCLLLAALRSRVCIPCGLSHVHLSR